MTSQLDPKKDPERRCLKLEHWPETDRFAWNTAVMPGNLLDPGGLAAHLSRHTLHKIQSIYGGWLTWLDINHLLDPAAQPADRINRERIVRYIDDLRQRNAPLTVLN